MHQRLTNYMHAFLTAATLTLCGIFVMYINAAQTDTLPGIDVADAWGTGKWFGVIAGLVLVGVSLRLMRNIRSLQIYERKAKLIPAMERTVRHMTEQGAQA